MRKPPKSAVVVVGSGPIRIGQGIEFDYSCVHAAWALRDAGRSAVVVNNIPKPSRPTSMSPTSCVRAAGTGRSGIRVPQHRAEGVMLAFGGQTAINLADELARRGVKLIGSDQRSLDLARTVRNSTRARTPRRGASARSRRETFREARVIARELGFPVIVRPSYVLGGAGWRSCTTRRNSPATSRARRRFRRAHRCWSTSICAASR